MLPSVECGNFKFARLNRTFAGAFPGVFITSSLLGHERGHGNKILKDEQHLFTFGGGAKITEEKGDLSLEWGGYWVFCTVEQRESALLPRCEASTFDCPGYLIAETEPDLKILWVLRCPRELG